MMLALPCRIGQNKLRVVVIVSLVSIILHSLLNLFVLVKVSSASSRATNSRVDFSEYPPTTPPTNASSTSSTNSTVVRLHQNTSVTTSNSNVTEEEILVEIEFPYPKQCQFEYTIADKDVPIHLVYHVGMLRNWKRVVMDQLQTLALCGLGYMASSLTVSYSAGNLEELQQVTEQFPFVTSLKQRQQLFYLPASPQPPWEREAMTYISRQCYEPKNNNSIVFYFHNKGVSHYEDDRWFNDCQPNITIWSYCNVIHWRKYMEFFLLEKPTLCLTAILHHGASTCGIDLHPFPSWHYSGNFWSATCNYIRTLPSSVLPTDAKGKHNYIDAELWVGNGIVHPPDPKTHVSFMDCYDLFNNVGLYRNVILPHQYSNLTKHLQGKYSHIWYDYLKALNGSVKEL